ncbi:MAG: DNA repair protein RecN, partial [Betaproteobacteria bacterium]|nr:DNA repair protein RecN [Betaproteobacteria bacterium]
RRWPVLRRAAVSFFALPLMFAGGSLVGEHKNLKTKIDNIRQNQATALQQQELFAHQLEELKQAQLSQNELNNIEADFKISANSQALTAEISEILEQLESETGANIQLPNLSHKLSAALAMDKKLAPAAALLSSAQLQTQEAVYELENYLNALTIDEEASSNMESRISEFHELGRKHNCKIQDLLIVQADLKKQLDEIALGADSLDELCAQLDALEGNYKTQAAALSNARTSSAAQLSVQVSQTMRLLGMPASEFKIDLVSKPDGVHLNGAEAAQFLVKTNLGQDFKLLNKIVSGGELSRISLAIAVVGSNSQLAPTLIFDEVDVGISGAVAEVVGRRLQELSATYQVICITHLAQVAAFARQHLRVSKTQNETGAQTAVEQLSEAEKVDEIARILGGSVITEKTRHAAAEMLELSH